jgi:hypothetical protein
MSRSEKKNVYLAMIVVVQQTVDYFVFSHLVLGLTYLTIVEYQKLDFVVESLNRQRIFRRIR